MFHTGRGSFELVLRYFARTEASSDASYFNLLKAVAMQTAQFQLHAEIEQKHWWFVARRQIIRQIVCEVLPPSRATVILDVGCGTGGNIADLAADYSCVGIDTSAEAIQLAKKRFPDVRFICGTAPADVAEILPQIRLVLLMDVLEHVADDKALLANLVLAAEPGTYFLITVPADPKLWSGHDVTFGHFRRYEAEILEELWANLPVGTMLVSHFNSRLYPLVKMARFMSRRTAKPAARREPISDCQAQSLTERSRERLRENRAD